MTIFIKTAETEAEKKEALAIRFRVFVQEQDVPAEEEVDQWEELAIHFLAYVDNQPVGTGRLRWIEPSIGKVERVAVLSKYRSLGIGRALMEAIETHARNSGTKELLLHAQIQAELFYRRQGYHGEGDTFLDAGIKHLAMRKCIETPLD